MRENEKDELQCPYCNHIHDLAATAEIISDFSTSRECGHMVDCENCNKAFEICIQHEYRVQAYAMKSK